MLYSSAPEEGVTDGPKAESHDGRPWEGVVRLGVRGGGRFRGDFNFLLDDFTTYLVSELGRSPGTAKAYIGQIHSVERWTGKPFWEIGSDELRAYKRDSPYAKTTKQHAVVAYHSLHKWALQDEVQVLTRHSIKVLSVVTPGHIPFSPRAPLPLHEARKLLEACERPLEFRVIYLGLYAGTRISESASIGEREWRRDRLVFVGKGAKERTVPIHPELERMRSEILSAKPSSVQVLHSSFARLRDRVEAIDCAGDSARSHSLRRTFADFLYDKADVPQEVVAALLGHGAKVTALYAPVRFDRMKDSVQRVNYYSGEPVQLSLFA